MKKILSREKYDYKNVKYNRLETDFEDCCHLSDSDELSSEPRNGFELKNRQNAGHDKSHSLVEYINYEVKPDESLRTIALRYGCSVSTIKRINHLMSDHEFYALRNIKLPVKKFGILSDVLVHQINSQSQADGVPEGEGEEERLRSSQETTPSNGSLTVNIGISQHLSHTDTESAFRFLTHLDEDLKKIRQSTESVIESSNIDNLNAIQNPIPRDCYDSVPPEKSSAFFTCDESDYGINWFNLLILAFVLCFLVPIFYVIYISEHTSHNSTDVHTH